MDAAKFQAMRGYRLDPPGHPQGVSCGAEGPAMGPIRLLAKTASGFEPRPAEELNHVLGRILARPIDSAELLPGLRTVARALNQGDLALAMIATTQMRLPYLSEEEARRAAALNKAASDDPKHPGWEKGTPGGRGGKFRPKEAPSEGSKQLVPIEESKQLAPVDETRRRMLRRAIRKALLKIISPERVLRLLRDVASNLVPGLDLLGDMDLVRDLVSTASEFAKLKRDTEAAIEFIKKAPYSLEDLRVAPENRSFNSYDQFTKGEVFKFYGSAGDGFDYHHIVEQGAENASISDLNSTGNIVRIPKILHEEITAIFSRLDPETKLTLRNKLQSASFDKQLEAGLKVMRELGILKQ